MCKHLEVIELKNWIWYSSPYGQWCFKNAIPSWPIKCPYLKCCQGLFMIAEKVSRSCLFWYSEWLLLGDKRLTTRLDSHVIFEIPVPLTGEYGAEIVSKSLQIKEIFVFWVTMNHPSTSGPPHVHVLGALWRTNTWQKSITTVFFLVMSTWAIFDAVYSGQFRLATFVCFIIKGWVWVWTLKILNCTS